MYKGKVLDTPGFSSLDLDKLTDEDIKDGFIEFSEFNCKYRDCMHIKERECKVIEALEQGKILETRYVNYKKFLNRR